MPIGVRPDPTAAADRSSFARKLRELMVWAGRTPDGIADRGRGPVSKSTVHNLLNGSTALREDTLQKFLKACGLAGSDQDPWLQKRNSLYPEARSTPIARSSALGPGLLVADCDPLALQVQPALQVDGLDALTPYVIRAHDLRIRKRLDAVSTGRSRMVTLVGGPATGKTRAAYEAIRYLDQIRPGKWRLWHPLQPTRAEAIVAGLDKVGPHTIVWLDEAHHYLAPGDGRVGEQIAAGLRVLLASAERGPVAVMATMPLEDWATLTRPRTHHEPGLHEQARPLLAGTSEIVPPAFMPLSPQDWGTAADPRLREAMDHARVTESCST